MTWVEKMCFSKYRRMKAFTLFKKHSQASKGFTLIELLVVIGILGILASALVATIDPFEQLKKAQDANVKNTIAEYLNANIRYYTTHSAMPWNDISNTYQTACLSSAPGGAYPFTATSTLTTAPSLGSMTPCLQALIGDGELKASFTNVTNVLSSIYVSGSTNSVTACFIPASKSQRNDPNTKWIESGSATQNGCPSATASNCFWCSE